MRPVVRHHFRGTKMALWLELIPKLHQADDLDPRYHLLDNYNNQSSFEIKGTRLLRMEDVNPRPTTEEPDLTTVTSTTLAPTSPSTTSTTTPRYQWRPTRRAYNRYRSTTRTPAYQRPSPSTPAAATSDDEIDTTLSLSLTVAVGCSLLLLNIMIFAGVYYQKDRIRQERKARQQEMMEHKALHRGGDGYGGCGGGSDGEYMDNHHPRISSTPDTDTNSSSMATPPVPPACITRHQVSPQTTVLPKQPIPVLPPQAPFARTLSRDSNYSTYTTNYHDSPCQRSPRIIRTLERCPDGQIRTFDREAKIRHSASADSGTEINCVNPITTV